MITPLLFGPDEGLAVIRRPAILRPADRGIAGRLEGRLELHSDAAEAPGGAAAGAFREEAGATAWWQPRAGGPRFFAALNVRQRQFAGAYVPDGFGSLALTSSYTLWGPLSLYAGGAGLFAHGSVSPRGLGDLYGGLALDQPLGAWSFSGGYQLDRLFDVAPFTGHSLRAAASWHALAPWLAGSEYFMQLRQWDGGTLGIRQRLLASVEYPVWRATWAGVLAQGIANSEWGGETGWDAVIGPRLRCAF